MARNSPLPGPLRRLLVWGAVALWASGCASSSPVTGPQIDAQSSMLVVEVRFPVPLGRDPSLEEAWLVHGPVHAGLQRLPELVPASFVKDSRAYLVDPEPGTWSLVAASYAYAPPRKRDLVSGVSGTVDAGSDTGHALLLSSDWVERTRTVVAPGRFAYMGTLELREGRRIDADMRFEDPLQERLAEVLRPGVTSRSGLVGRLSRTHALDAEASSLREDEASRDALWRAAKLDLAGSTWAAFVPEPRPLPEEEEETATQLAREPASSEPRPLPPEPAPRSAPSVAAVPEPQPPPRSPGEEARLRPLPPAPETEASRRVAPSGEGVLARVVPGMSHGDVRALLGEPDERAAYLTARALIPFYDGPDVQRRVWIYHGRARVEFSLNSATGSLRVVRVEDLEAVAD